MPARSSSSENSEVSEESHRQRDVAESFGVDAVRYDRARPRYPSEFLEPLVGEFPGPAVLDVGCGTGIVARALSALGCDVLGVEPDVRMAVFARGSGVAVEVATFEGWDPVGRQFDAVVAGQTWHWVDPVAGAVRAAQVLRPRGVLSVFWNVQRPSPELAAAFAEVYRAEVPDSVQAAYLLTPDPDPYSTLRAQAVAGLEESGGFEELREGHIRWQHTCSRDAWLDQVPTHGGHAQMSTETLAAILRGLGAAVDVHGGELTIHGATTAVTARRTVT